MTPASVNIAVMSDDGVTSNAGFQTRTRSSTIRSLVTPVGAGTPGAVCRKYSAKTAGGIHTLVTSSASRSSMLISEPQPSEASSVVSGAAMKNGTPCCFAVMAS